jgi:hypothetical protein
MIRKLQADNSALIARLWQGWMRASKALDSTTLVWASEPPKRGKVTRGEV